MNTHKILALGTNVGDRYAQLRRSKVLLAGSGIEIITESSIYETEPVDCTDDTWFFNQVICIKTEKTAVECHQACKEIEAHMGRTITERNAPRPIDIDLLVWEDLVVVDDKLTIPHPRIHGRKFVLIPLLEICPDPSLIVWLVENIHGQTIKKISTPVGNYVCC